MFPTAHRSLVDQDAEYLNTKERFLDFLRQDEGQGLYDKKIQSMVDNKQSRLTININDLRLFDVKLTQRLLKLPTKVIPPFEEALQDYIKSKPHLIPDKEQQSITVNYHIGFEGSFGSHLVTPRQLGASFLKKLVCLEGIVTHCSLVRPKVVISRHWCQETGKQYSRQYHDATSLSAPPTIVNYPTHDENGNILSTEYGLSCYKDHQMISVQEMPERAPAGQLPVSVDVLLDHDLVDIMKPGDRLHIMGVYRAIPKNGAFYKTVLIANHVRIITQDEQSSKMTAQDIKMIKNHAKDPLIFTNLAQSVAPSIYGHLNIKKAILLMLLGGREHNLANGTHLRGDINILLIGDPSTAKSQLLRFVLNIAPLAINTTGKGASGVGLTAAVSSDKETGERVLEAGAAVLADRGIVCIDEFDKMSEDDRVSIHEVMEQQTVTVSKAGIHTTLNARCSVLAAANPVYGQYNREKKPTENIGLPDSLLSRFDLLFIVLDNFDPVHNRRISGHVLRMHRYRDEDHSHGNASKSLHDYATFDQQTTAEEEAPIYVQYNQLLHGDSIKKDQQLFSTQFLKKYILYAKHRVNPKITPEAASYISKAYSDLRSKEDMKTLPVTPRTLDAMIRLTVAHAKCRLSHQATEDDARVALEIMSYALYHEVQPNSENTETTTTLQEEIENEKLILTNNQNDIDQIPSIGKRKRQDTDFMDNEEMPQTKVQKSDYNSSISNSASNIQQQKVKLSSTLADEFGKLLVKYMTSRHLSECLISDLLKKINTMNPSKQFTLEESIEAVKYLEKKGNLLFRDDTVHLF